MHEPRPSQGRGSHLVESGSLRSQRIELVTPDVSCAQAFVRAPARASFSVAASTLRHARAPSNSTQTSQRTPASRKLETTTKPPIASSATSAIQDVDFTPSLYRRSSGG